MLRLVEDGEMYRLRRFWDARKPECIQSAKRNVIHVGIREFSCALVVFSIGVLLSLLVLALEMYETYKRKCGGIKFKLKFKRKGKKSQNEVKGVIIPYTN